MNTSRENNHKSLLAMVADPPNAIAGLCAFMAVLHVSLEFTPARLARQTWRYFDLSPRTVLRALDNEDYLRVARSLIGYMFFHVNAVHLLMNLAAIIVLGGIVFREMEARGTERRSDASTAFVAFFLISGMAAAMVFVLANPQSYQPMIGASGAAAGLAGACAWIFVTRSGVGQPRPGAVKNAVILVVVSAVLIGLNIFADLSPVSVRLFGTVSAWQAHVGGYVFGVLFYPLFERLAGPRVTS